MWLGKQQKRTRKGVGWKATTYAGLARLDGLHAVPLVHEGGEAGYEEDVAGEVGC